jgi:hypothetical protein
MQASDVEAAAGSQEQRDDAEMFTVQQLKAMEQRSWNDGRLDDLNKRVDDGFKRMDAGFARVDQEFKAVRGEMRDEFKAVRSEMSAGFDRLFWRLVSTGLSVAAAAFALAQLL